MMMLKMVMMVETAHWNMGGAQVSLKAMKSRVILSVKMEFPAPFCEATTRDMYVSCSAAQSLRLSWFPTLAFLTHISFSPQFSFKCQQHLFKRRCESVWKQQYTTKCNREKVKILNGSLLQKRKNSNWIKMKLKMRLFLLVGSSLPSLLLQLLD